MKPQVSFRLPDEKLDAIEELVEKDVHYRDKSHFIDVAVTEKLEQEMEYSEAE